MKVLYDVVLIVDSGMIVVLVVMLVKCGGGVLMWILGIELWNLEIGLGVKLVLSGVWYVSVLDMLYC